MLFGLHLKKTLSSVIPLFLGTSHSIRRSILLLPDQLKTTHLRAPSYRLFLTMAESNETVKISASNGEGGLEESKEAKAKKLKKAAKKEAKLAKFEKKKEQQKAASTEVQL